MELAIIENGLSAVKTVDFAASKQDGITYLTARPKPVKFDGKTGDVVIGRNGEKVDTVSGANGESTPVMAIIPVRFHTFQSEKGLYKNEKTQKWGELFFVNEHGELCSALFHGQSLDNLIDALRYATTTKGWDWGAFSLKVTTFPKLSPKGNYFVRRFLSEKLDTNTYLDWLKTNTQPIFNYFTIAEWSVKNKRFKFEEVTPDVAILHGQEMGIFE